MSTRWIAASAWAVCVVLVALSIPLSVANRHVDNEIEPYLANLVVAALAFSTVGALVAYRRRENPIGWLLLGTGILYAVELFTGNYSTYALFIAPGSLPGGVVTAWMTTWAWIAGGSLVLFVFLFFPDGRLPSPRWRPVAWLVLINSALAVAPYAFGPGPLREFSEESPVINPVGIEGSAGIMELFARISIVLLIPISLGLVLAFYIRFRRAAEEERQQIKWVAYAIALFASVVIAVSVWPSLDGSVVGGVLFLAGFLAIPSAIVLAILRHRLYDIDVIVNRTLVYGALTLLLALIYFGSIALMKGILIALTGQQSQLAAVASTLVIAALFNPVRRRIQAFIDRRFYRRKYDAAKTLDAFGAKLRDEVDLENLTADLVALVEQTMQPAHVSLWLRRHYAREADIRMQRGH